MPLEGWDHHGWKDGGPDKQAGHHSLSLDAVEHSRPGFSNQYRVSLERAS